MKEENKPIIQLFTVINDSSTSGMNEARELINMNYGTDREQVMDIHIPAGQNENTKTFILLHGGGWSGGSRHGVSYIMPLLKAHFPNHAIVNMDYRLASFDRPAFPMQVQDIEKAVQFIDSTYGLNGPYAFIGVSAGAHLALLYSYRHDTANQVKAVCSIVGPADFTDPYYMSHPYYALASQYLLGNAARKQGSTLEISPVAFVTPQSPPTILFYGGRDQLVPASQAVRLKAKLDASGVINEYHPYAEGGHGGWNPRVMNDFREKLIAFLQQHF